MVRALRAKVQGADAADLEGTKSRSGEGTWDGRLRSGGDAVGGCMQCNRRTCLAVRGALNALQYLPSEVSRNSLAGYALKLSLR